MRLTCADPGAVELAKELDGLPLPLVTAGAYLDQVATTCVEYLRMYKDSWLKLQETSPAIYSCNDRALRTTWQLSYDHIKQKNELSAKLLQFWAYFDNQDLWFELLQDYSLDAPEWVCQLTEDEFSFTEAMRLLCRHGLVDALTSSEEPKV